MKLQAPRAAKRTKHDETGVVTKSCTLGEYRNGDGTVSRAKKCDFDVFLSEETSLYTPHEIRRRKLRGEYVPGDKADAKQIKAAAKEYCCRGLNLQGYESKSPFVKVAENIANIPPPDKVPSHFDVKVGGGIVRSVRRIVFFLCHDGDLFLVKIASGPTHSHAVTRLIGQSNEYQDARDDIFAFSSNGTYELPGTKTTAATVGANNTLGSGLAPDFGILSLYPTRDDGIPWLRGVFLAEVEVFHRNIAALIGRLSKYATTIPQNKYLCGIKIYKEHDQKVHRAAIGVVWKRTAGATNYEAIQIMNFGRQPAKTSEIDQWIGIESTALGRLSSCARTPSQWRHRPAVTYGGLPAVKSKTNGAVTLRITDADLVEGGVEDSAGRPVDPDANLSFHIDFGKILSASDGVVG